MTMKKLTNLRGGQEAGRRNRWKKRTFICWHPWVRRVKRLRPFKVQLSSSGGVLRQLQPGEVETEGSMSSITSESFGIATTLTGELLSFDSGLPDVLLTSSSFERSTSDNASSHILSSVGTQSLEDETGVEIEVFDETSEEIEELQRSQQTLLAPELERQMSQQNESQEPVAEAVTATATATAMAPHAPSAQEQDQRSQQNLSPEPVAEGASHTPIAQEQDDRSQQNLPPEPVAEGAIHPFIAQEQGDRMLDIDLASHVEDPFFGVELATDVVIFREFYSADIDLRMERRNRCLRKCRTCFQENRRTINYPCGCFCNCRTCAPLMRFCALCQAGIEFYILIL